MLGWDGIEGEKDLLVDAVQRWSSTPGLAFVDAYLAAAAQQQRRPVYTKNVRELVISAPGDYWNTHEGEVTIEIT